MKKELGDFEFDSHEVVMTAVEHFVEVQDV